MDEDQRSDDDARMSPWPGSQESDSAGGRIDWKRALETTAGDDELLIEVLGAFGQESPVLVANIRQAIAANDAELLHRAAHTIKNAFYSLGAQASGDLAWELEKTGQVGDFPRASELIELLEVEYRQVSQEVDRYVDEHGEAAQ